MPPSHDHAQQGLVKQYLRGSSLLLLGRLFAILVNLAVQVLIVRYLVKTDFGAFAYAMAAVSMGATCVLLGLNGAVNRFVPIYLEQRDYGRAVGTILIAVANCLGLAWLSWCSSLACRIFSARISYNRLNRTDGALTHLFL